jgi:hypothetical protein
MRVSLAPPRIAPADAPAAPLLDPAGAATILGGFAGALPVPIAPAAHTLFGPRGGALLGPDGPLVVSDTGHHRLLIWRRRPRVDLEPADFVIGQPGFEHERSNGGGDATAATFHVPTGVAAGGGALAVADAWNHRVLIWHGVPRDNQPADVVLGQASGSACLPNRGAGRAGADTLHWCYGVAICDGKLWVADTGNRRVLMWNAIPERTGAPADLVLGQRTFTERDENAGGNPGAVGMRWPHAIAVWCGELMIADAGNNRIMGWRSPPGGNGAPCDYVLGQATATEIDHNRGAYYPTAATLNMPYGLAVLGDRLAVADTASSRLVGFAPQARTTNALARSLSAQHRFCDKGDNRWGPVARDTVSWPYAITACGATAVIADTGNNRVLLWESTPCA